MFQVLIEKMADWLFPFVLGLGVWYGLHYVVLTPRILNVDLTAQYQDYHTQHNLPRSVGECVRDNMAYALLQHGRLEAALMTATLNHINQPYADKRLIAESSLDETCGVSVERQKQRKAQARELEAHRIAEEKARMEVLAKKKRELEQQATDQYQEQIKKQMNFFLDLLSGGK